MMALATKVYESAAKQEQAGASEETTDTAETDKKDNVMDADFEEK